MTAPRPLRVILADDHAVVRDGLRHALEKHGTVQVVAEAADGGSAQASIDRHRPDVVVTDIRMPVVDGIALTHWIREEHPDIGVVVLTAYDDDPYLRAIMRAGAHAYVLKTADPEAIANAVQRAHEGRYLFDDAVMPRIVARFAGDSGGAAEDMEALSRRELEVLRLAGTGATNKEIATALSISSRTVQSHLARIYRKLGAGGRTEAVMRAVALGLLGPPP